VSHHDLTLRVVIVIFLLLAGVPTGGGGDELAPSANPSTTVEIEIDDRAGLHRLTSMVSIENVRGEVVQAVVTARQLEELDAAGWRFKIVPTAGKAEDPEMCADGWVEDSQRPWNCYPSYRQYEDLLYAFAGDHPDLCQLVDLGPTANLVRPHRLWALIISDNPGQEENEPEVLLTSTMHGDEASGFVLMLRFINQLISGYGTDAEITALVDETEIWINPLANPDGTYFGGDETVAEAIRFYTTTAGTSSGVDANRNFPAFSDRDHPDGSPWWPETQAMIALAEANTFVLSANFHDGAEVVNYPWDTVERRHPDDLWFEDLARDWAVLAQTDGPGGYMTGISIDGITNGFDWYQVIGSRQDFMTYFHGGREVTIELSETKSRSGDDLVDLWTWNRRALLDFLKHGHRGIRGVVTDANGSPLEATVEVLGVDREADGSTVRTDPDIGDYHRLLLPGLYDLRIEARDFRPLEAHGIVVTEGEATTLDVVLQRVIRRPSDRRAPTVDGKSTHHLQR
jgi:hypothetical protein